MESHFWTSTASRRLPRRRFLAGASAAAAGSAVLLAGCGSSGHDKGSSDTSRLIGNEPDTTKEARHGGEYLDSYASEIVNMDPLFIVGNIISHLTPVYGTLLDAGLSVTQK